MRELSIPLTDEDKVWMKSRNMLDELAAAEAAESTEPDETTDDGELPDDYNEWTIPQLKKELSSDERKLPTSGTKAELIARLVEDDEAAEREAAGK